MTILNAISQFLNPDKKIFKEWESHLLFLSSVKPDHSVVTYISLDNNTHQILLIYQDKKVFFMEKKLNQPLKILSSIIHPDIQKNHTVWESVKASKERGVVLANSSLYGFIIEKINAIAGYSGFNFEDELTLWRELTLFTKNMQTESIDIPAYVENQNIWVD